MAAQVPSSVRFQPFVTSFYMYQREMSKTERTQPKYHRFANKFSTDKFGWQSVKEIRQSNNGDWKTTQWT